MKEVKNKKQNTTDKNKKLKQMLLVGVGLTATGVAGYFGWQYFKKSKEDGNKTTSFEPQADPIPEYKPTNTYTPPTTNTNSNTYTNYGNDKDTNKVKDINDNVYNLYNSNSKKDKSIFPLKKGSKGDKVRQLQQALIAQHGESILPKYGADGDFGTEMVNALKKLKYPTKVTESLFNVITSSKGSNTNSLAKQLVKALSQHDFPKTISLLQQIKSVSEYSTTSDEFKTMRVNGGVRQTLVNGCLNAFLDSKQKQTIRLEFIRMGLKFDGKKWTINGLDGTDNEQLITIRPTRVWIDAFNHTLVQRNTILGRPLAKRLDLILFENNGQHFMVRANDVAIKK